MKKHRLSFVIFGFLVASVLVHAAHGGAPDWWTVLCAFAAGSMLWVGLWELSIAMKLEGGE